MKIITLKSILFVCMGLIIAPIAFAMYYDVPSSPTKVHALSIQRDGCRLGYDRPISDGGSRITGYLIEYKYNMFTRWVRVNRFANVDLEYQVTGMIEGRSARFRVSAINDVGISNPSKPSESIEFLN